AVLIARHFWGPDMAIMAGGGAMIGHLFPVWLRFKGGKGVATALGVLLALAWPLGLIACAMWLAVALLFRYSSLAALLALAAAPARWRRIRGWRPSARWPSSPGIAAASSPAASPTIRCHWRRSTMPRR